MGNKMRNMVLENRLQDVLNHGGHVWVIGDVHGHYQTFISLIEQLELRNEDCIVLLGDLIDRGPQSFGVVDTVVKDERMMSLKGNHEVMMIEQFTKEKLNKMDMDFMLWLRNGGVETIDSYIRGCCGVEATSMDDDGYHRLDQHIKIIESWPTEIVLNDWRLVHAGYHPEVHVDQQNDEDLLWIRSIFHRTSKPIDDLRTIVFGHTPTACLPNFNDSDWGKVWYHGVKLRDGRASAIGIDTCLYHGHEAPSVLTAFDLQTQSIVQQHRVEPS